VIGRKFERGKGRLLDWRVRRSLGDLLSCGQRDHSVSTHAGRLEADERTSSSASLCCLTTPEGGPQTPKGNEEVLPSPLRRIEVDLSARIGSVLRSGRPGAGGSGDKETVGLPTSGELPKDVSLLELVDSEGSGTTCGGASVSVA
jgi:hypothetical protein